MLVDRDWCARMGCRALVAGESAFREWLGKFLQPNISGRTDRAARGVGGFYNEYAWYLVTKPGALPGDGSKAVVLAQTAVDRTQGRNANFFDTPARAHVLAGDLCKAVEDEKKAVSLATW
jgi:hypothetical protein